MTDIPKSWVLAPLLELATLLRGVTYRKGDASDAPVAGMMAVLRANNIADRRFNLTNLVYVLGALISERQVVRKGDIVVATSSGSVSVVGKAAQADEDLHVAFGAFCGLFRPSDAVEPRYLGHFMSSAEYRERASHMARGVNINNLKREHFASISVPLAPLAEQRRIADKLDALLTRVDACRDRLDRVPAILKRFREAVLSAAVRGQLTRAWREANEATRRAYSQRPGPDLSCLAVDAKPSDKQLQEWLVELPACWRVERASEVVEAGADIVYGIVQPGPKRAEGVPYVRGMDIVDGTIRVEQLLRTSPEIAQRYARASITGGDVLLGIIRATKVAVVPDTLNGANITQGTARFRPSDKLLTRYLAAVLEAPETQRWLHGHYRGIDMPGLNLADVRRVPIPLPSLEEQAEVIRRVDSLLALAETLEARLATARARVERLTPALLAKAFRGELVPQDSNDEPASVMLARLSEHLSRAETGTARTRRTKQS